MKDQRIGSPSLRDMLIVIISAFACTVIMSSLHAYERLYAIFAECPVLWTGMNASGEVRGGEAIPSLAQCREAALLRKSERKLRRFAPRCPDLWSGSFTRSELPRFEFLRAPCPYTAHKFRGSLRSRWTHNGFLRPPLSSCTRHK